MRWRWGLVCWVADALPLASLLHRDSRVACMTRQPGLPSWSVLPITYWPA